MTSNSPIQQMHKVSAQDFTGIFVMIIKV
jgi:hypothetical protein